MTADFANFYARFPVQRPWLREVVDCLMTEPKGAARISRIADRIEPLHRGVKQVESTIYSAVRGRCVGLEGHDRSLPALFDMPEPGVLRLLSFPTRPAVEDRRLTFLTPDGKWAYDRTKELLKGARLLDKWDAFSRDEKMTRLVENAKLREWFEEAAASYSSLKVDIDLEALGLRK